ncbi:uncharacterized protein TRIADDRAFT_2710, partial [Trichoplax adhaerens]
ADPNHPDDTFGSPFHLAVANANPQNASALIATMLRAGADPNLRATDEGLTPLHVAAAWARPRCLQQLISHGGDPSITTACGQTVSELIDDITNDDDRSICKSLFSYTPEIKSPKYHHNQNLARINKEVASLEVTNLTENDSYNATSEAITLQQEGPSDEEIWSNYVSDGNSIESESDTIIYDWNEICSRLSLASSDLSKGNFEEEVEIPSVMLSWSNDKIRQELKDYGEIPGPITATTKKVYLTYIVKLKQQIYNQADPNRKWREGTAKHSFNYLLLDSRITKNLPSRSKGCSDTELMKDFIRAVFYIGKGQKARPFAHFYEAIKATDSPAKKSGKKVERIQEIWNEGLGIISLHCFQSVIPVEAYTREAAMIDAIGISNLTNERKGDYYGVARTWVHVKRRKLGAYLLYRAMKILLNEGERPL